MENIAQFIGKPYLLFAEIDSTNTFLQHWAMEEDLPEGAAVSALYQNNGRGQRGTNWISSAGENILTSILLYPDFLKPDEQFWLSKTIALGVKEFVKKMLPNEEIYIKWPNDIYVNDRKIAGILIENTLQGNMLRNSVVGIGININELQDVAEKAISLKQVTGQTYNISHLLPMLYMEIEQMYLQLKYGNRQHIEAFYNDSLYGLGKILTFTDNILHQPITGKITGTTPYGALCVQTDSGLYSYNLKEISLL